MRDRIWCYGRWDGATPELAVERALSFTEQGLTALKGDPFDHRGLFIPIEAERLAIRKLEAVRGAVGDDVELLVEVHGRLAPSDAIRIGNAMEPYRPFVYEEPVPPQNIDALQRVAEAVSIPIATGERLYTKWDYADLLSRQIVAMIQPDIVQGGGILELKKIAAMAEAHYVGFQPHNPYGPLCTIASLHLDACVPNFMIQEGGIHPWFQDVCFDGFPRQKDGLPAAAPGSGPRDRDRRGVDRVPPLAQRRLGLARRRRQHRLQAGHQLVLNDSKDSHAVHTPRVRRQSPGPGRPAAPDGGWLAERAKDPNSRFLVMPELDVPLSEDDGASLSWLDADDVRWFGIEGEPVLLGLLDGAAHFALHVPATSGAAARLRNYPSIRFVDARSAAPVVSGSESGIIAQARAQLDWHTVTATVRSAARGRRWDAEGSSASA